MNNLDHVFVHNNLCGKITNCEIILGINEYKVLSKKITSAISNCFFLENKFLGT